MLHERSPGFLLLRIAVQVAPTSVFVIVSSDEEMPYEDSDSENPCEDEESIAKTECHLATSQVFSQLHCCQHFQSLDAPFVPMTLAEIW